MEIMEERQVDKWKDLENTEENCERIWKRWKKPKLNSGKILEYTEENCEMIWKIWKKAKASRIVKRFGKYRRKLWKDMEIMKER